LNSTYPLQQHTFYISLNDHLVIDSFTPSFAKVITDLSEGQVIDDFFILKNPALPLTASTLSMFDGQLITISPKHNTGLIFGGSFNKTANGYVFIGYPQLTEMNQLANFGLNLSDFLNHDPINFYVGTVQLKDSMYKDLITLNEKLKKSKDELQSLVEQRTRELLQSEKMASLGTLAAGVAHEINNPMGFVISNLDTLKKYTEDMKPLLSSLISLDVEKRKELEKLLDISLDWQELEYITDDLDPLISESLNGGQRVSKTVAGLKSFAHPSDSSHNDVSLKEVIELALSLTMNEVKHKGELVYPVFDDVVIKGNLTELSQVFVNLVVNAAHALTVDGVIEIKVIPTTSSVKVKVQDNGHGIKPENLHKLFQPFFTTKNVGSGTGLGLAISHGIVESHGGSITVESIVDQGTTFTIELPLVNNA